ncbi:MAG: hypothetical protein ACHQ1H_02640 [Nitrososphaerales archaeon]
MMLYLSSVKIIAQASVLNCHIRVKPADNAMIAGGALGQDLVQDRNPLAATTSGLPTSASVFSSNREENCSDSQMEKDDDPPKKKQAGLGRWFAGADKEAKIIISTPCPCVLSLPDCVSHCSLVAELILSVSFCGKGFGNAGARVTHEAFCKNQAAMALEIEQDAVITRSLFDWDRWAEEWVNRKKARRALSRLDKEGEDADGVEVVVVDAMDVDDVALVASPADVLSRKAKKLRKRYRLRLKIQILNIEPEVRSALARRSGIAIEVVPKLRVYQIISKNSGVPSNTIDKWFRKETVYRQLYNDKFNRKKENFGSGRKPLYPNGEKTVAVLVKERRRKHQAVSKGMVIRELAKAAKAEDAALFALHPITDDIFFGFLWRCGFSFRLPSNVKSLAKSEAVKRIRGFWCWLIRVLKGDIPISLGETDSIHPKYGRFPPRARRNKDEVPGNFGDSAKIVSLTGESATVLQIPEGWGDRLCTMNISSGPGGMDTPVGLVFKGTGVRLKAEELDYYKTLKNIVVTFQENAWVDTKIELKFVESMIKPIVAKVKKYFVDKGEPFPGVLLIQDNFKPHFAEYCFLAPEFIVLLTSALDLSLKPCLNSRFSLWHCLLCVPTLVNTLTIISGGNSRLIFVICSRLIWRSSLGRLTLRVRFLLLRSGGKWQNSLTKWLVNLMTSTLL